MVFLWFSYGFPMVFLWFSYGFPMVFQRVASGNARFSHHSLNFPSGFPAALAPVAWRQRSTSWNLAQRKMKTSSNWDGNIGDDVL